MLICQLFLIAISFAGVKRGEASYSSSGYSASGGRSSGSRAGGLFGRGGIFGRNIYYASASGKPFSYTPGSPIYANRFAPLLINSQSYFWSRSYYRPAPGRPVVCEIRFNDEYEVLSDVYLLDDNNNLIAANRSRPSEVIYDCPSGFHCCNAECCDSNRMYYILGGIALVLMIAFMVVAAKDIILSFRHLPGRCRSTPMEEHAYATPTKYHPVQRMALHEGDTGVKV